MKKNFYLLILTLASFLFCGAGNAWAQTIVLSENFDTADFDSKWERRSCKSSSARYQHGSSSAHSGNFDFKFDYNTAPPQYLISKTELSIPDGATVHVSFYHKAASVSWEESFQLGYSTTDNETASFSWATEVKTKATSWTEYTTDVLPAGTKYIAIRYTANNKYNLFIDDIVVSYEAASSCAKPSDLSYSNLEAETVELSWTAGGTESAWNVLYKAGSAEWATIENVTTNPYTLSVEPTTSYQVKVQAVCGVGDESPASNAVSFTSPCVATTLPIENDFSSALNSCWTRVDCHSETTVTGGAFKFRWNTNPPQYLITPGFVASAKVVSVEFDYWIASTSYPETFQVGYSTTTNELSSFTYESEITAINKESVLKYSTTFPIGTKYVAIRYNSNDKNALFIDNLKIKALSSCHDLATLSDASAITSEGATFTWTTEGTENRFQYACVASGVTPSSWTLLDEDVFSHTVTGCEPETSYDFYVRAYCDESEQSEYLKKSFTTLCGAVSLPLENDFSSALSSCWTRVACEANSKVDGGKFQFVYNTNPPQYLITPEFNSAGKAVSVEFKYWIASSSYPESFQVGYSTTTNEVSAFTYEDEITSTNTSAANPSTYTTTFPAETKFVSIKYNSYDKNRLNIDDLKIKAVNTCAAPSSLSASSVASSGATLSWTKGSTESAWVVEYSTSSTFASDKHEVNAATNSNFELPGLSASTKYYVHVKAVCGVGDESSYSDAINFTTACPAQALPLEEDFSGSISCWTQVACTSGTGVSSGAFKFQYNTTPPQYLISPELEVSAKGLQVEFDYRVQTSMWEESFAVGYSTTTNAISAFTWGTEQTGLVNTSYTNYSEIVPAGVKYVAIKYTANDKSALYIDNLSISEAPNCYKPQNLSAAGSITPEGATFTWEASGHGETTYQWAVAVGSDAPVWVDDAAHKVNSVSATVIGLTAGTSYKFYVRSYCANDDQSEALVSAAFSPAIAAPTDVNVASITHNAAAASWTAAANVTTYQWCVVAKNATATWNQSVTGTSASLSGLTANTEYDFYVRSYYAATGATAAAEKVTFRTACDAITVDASHPYSETFNDVEMGSVPGCWNNTEGTTTNASYKWAAAGGGQDGRCMRFNSSNNGSGKTNILASPVFELDADADLVFWAKNPKTGDYKVQISVDGEARTNLVTGMSNVSDWVKKEAVLTSYNGHSIQFFFCATSDYSESPNGYIYLDEFQIIPTSCRKPASDPVVSSKDDTHATITWTAGGTNTDYQFCLAPAGTPEGDLEWKAENVLTALTTTVTGLEPVHSYDFYVRTYCDEFNQSDARKVTFHTSCGIYNAPFDEDFNGQTAHGNDGVAPECWDNSTSTMTTLSYLWQVVNYSGRNGSKCLRCGSMADEEKTNILVSPEIRLGAGKQLLTFWCKKAEADNLVVKVTKDNGANFTELLDLSASVMADWTLKYVEIPAAFSSQVVKFYFCNTAVDQGSYIYIDNVRVARGEFFDDAANSGVEDRIDGLDGQTIDFVTNRPMQFNGAYNTLCLPFDISAAELADNEHPLYNNTVKVFDYATIGDNELQLAIRGASSIEAGVPCFVKYDGAAGDPRSAFLFKEVTIKAGLTPTVDGDASYKGIYEPIVVTAETDNGPHHIIFVGADNQLYWPGVNRTMRGFRAYFYIDSDQLNDTPIKHGMPARLVERQNTPTAVENTNAEEGAVIKRLENNQVVIIRNGVKYSIQGQKIQ